MAMWLLLVILTRPDERLVLQLDQERMEKQEVETVNNKKSLAEFFHKNWLIIREVAGEQWIFFKMMILCHVCLLVQLS